jgi:hypothetical protein
MSNEGYKRNERCIVGLPRCDYVFNSNRSCFIAYGFSESILEMEILRDILQRNSIEVFEAGQLSEPGKNAFCTKICSKIITSQFCIVLLNNSIQKNIQIPNANVNMEYGLMLGFHKYVIPFQRQTDSLPFNVSGLDTVKYTNTNFKEKATKAIELAIAATKPKSDNKIPVDRIAEKFLLIKDVFVCPIEDVGNKTMYDLGSPFGYYLLNDYSGIRYHYLGIFNNLTLEQIKWRVNKLQQAITARFSENAITKKVELGIIQKGDVKKLRELLKLVSSWVIVQSPNDKIVIQEYVKNLTVPFEIFDAEEMNKEIDKIEHL